MFTIAVNTLWMLSCTHLHVLLRELSHPSTSSLWSEAMTGFPPGEKSHVLDTNLEDLKWDMHRRTHAHEPPNPFVAHYHFSCASAFISTAFHHGSFVCKTIADPFANCPQRIPNPLSPPCAPLLFSSSSVCSADLRRNRSQGPADKWIAESFCDGREERVDEGKGWDLASVSH